jgi:hypothetical protein
MHWDGFETASIVINSWQFSNKNPESLTTINQFQSAIVH